jgi:hypothetical protein
LRLKERRHVRNEEDCAPEMQGANDVDRKYLATALDVMKLRSELYAAYIRTHTDGAFVVHIHSHHERIGLIYTL